MAGIGFELRKMLAKRTFLGELGALFYAAMLSSGPWLASILCLSLLSVYASMQLSLKDAEIFRALCVYTYGASLLLVGAGQLVVTRYLADQHYIGSHAVTMGSFLTYSVVTLVPALLVGFFGYATLEVSAACRFWGVLLLLSVCMVWIAMIYISAIRDYQAVVFSFFGGCAVGVVAATMLGSYYGYIGYLAGFTLGQCIIFMSLVSRMLIEFEETGCWDWGTLAYFPKMWIMALVGVFYNAAIWIDKVIFWNAPDSRMVIGWLRVHDLYDSPLFFSYLTIVPSMAIFLLRVETSFHERIRSYYAYVTGKGTMSQILAQKKLLVDDLRVNLRYLFVVQSAVTGCCIAFAPALVEKLKLFPVQATIMRVALAGTFIQALLAVTIVVLFYFDRRKSVLLTTFVYFVTMALFSWISTRLGYQFYGYGYAASNLVSLAVAYQLLERALRDLEYVTFSREPV
jgi:uncharacterized membrane protein